MAKLYVFKGEQTNMKRCADGCKYYNTSVKKPWCELRGMRVKNAGRFCSKFKPLTFWDKIIRLFK